jgi:flagellar basal body rod protein FlgF
MQGRGTEDHVWRVFDHDGKEYLVKNFKIEVPSQGQKTGEDWSVVCEGSLVIERETSTAVVR